MSSIQTNLMMKSNNDLENGPIIGSTSSAKTNRDNVKQIVEPPNPSLPPNRLEELDLNNCAVEIKDLRFTYNKANGYLLDGITMTFPRSAIYGFLGPSGCGKTTIIKIIAGLLKPSSGIVLVNGRAPRHPKNHIPGPGIGYMSQDICLLDIFTIKETFTYFGRIYGLSKDYTNKRIDFITKFLDLPDKNRSVKNLSGGQQRRTSLGVAIIHNPPILILDEPTVGVDPILREKIWIHLLKLSNEEKTSIMITTHYIDECRRAHVIGLMRSGKLLAESSPNILMTHFKTDNLEKVFLKLCRAEEEKLNDVEMPADLDKIRTTNGYTGSKAIISTGNNCKPTSFMRFKSLIIKDFFVIWRKKITLLLEIFLPIVTLVLFAICIGNKPFDLNIALNSEERRDSSVDISVKLSEDYLKHIDNKTIILIEYDSQESAIESVKEGKVFGVLHVTKNFSNAMRERSKAPLTATDKVILQSTIFFSGDLSDMNIFIVIYRTLFEAMIEFLLQMVEKKSSNITDPSQKPNQKALKPLIEITKPPIYGSNDPLFKEFLLPGIIVTGSFMLSAALTGLSLIEDRRKGLMERTLVAGVKFHEILLAMICVHMFIAVFQTILSVITVYVVFEFQNDGNYLLVVALILMQSITGMSLGLLISSLADTTKMAVVIVVGAIIPFLLISGIVWPLEGMKWQEIQYFSYLLPQTIPIKVLRAVTQKGWFINRFFVWLGYFVPIVWSIIFIVLTIIATKLKTD